jgi:isoquinoline 1-oxidoreductase alpha subunit
MRIILNEQAHEIPAQWRDDTLLNVLREHFRLTGAKFGCGVGLCGACTVIVDGGAARSCTIRVGDIPGASVRTTIEGLSTEGTHPVQEAWIEHDVPQCGYCQAGQIMTAVALLEAKPSPMSDEIDQVMDGNLCRCGTYQRIRIAIRQAVGRAS